MRVLHVTPYFPPTWAYGGIPRIVHGLTRALAAQEVDCTVWTTDALDSRRAEVPPDREVDGVRVLVSRNLSNRLAYDHQLFLPWGARAALDAVGDVDLVHLHGHRHLLNNAAADWARARGVPYVMTPNGTLPRHERKVGAKLLWDLLVSGRVPQGAAQLIAVSQAERGQFLSHGVPPERVARIPNGLSLEEFAELPPRGHFKARWGIQGRVVAYLGQVSPRKGVEHLVEAFADGGVADATLVIGGNDMGAMATARARADARVVFTGLLEGPERLALLVDADVLVYPSTAEVFGLVPFEGLMCGAPVVVGGDCGCGELIGAAGAGLLVRHADVEGLRARIRTLLRDRDAADAMVARGRRYVEANLSFEVVAARHRDLYQQVLA
ncbi:MAG: glycosyltransferase family 4 protein [Alphaproteobacteria bacterium]|nr:glycosyltransferase family 4 protein [Alphaproteobacteria bacterium]